MPGFYSLIGASGGCLVATSVIEPFGMTIIELWLADVQWWPPGWVGLRR
jgi:hypothetical protein